jgi:hypothetical protein
MKKHSKYRKVYPLNITMRALITVPAILLLSIFLFAFSAQEDDAKSVSDLIYLLAVLIPLIALTIILRLDTVC